MQSIEDLKEKIRSLEAERLRLKNELDSLRRTAENRAAALEGDVSAMREELSELREILGTTANTQPPKAMPVKQVTPITTTAVPEPPPKESPPPMPEPVPAKTTLDSLMDNLNEDEIRVVKILQTHDGKYPQKAIRVEAKLSWLQANRVITHLTEQGIISIEKDGPLENVILADELKK
jgi:uncharacterized membrane protein